jgi:hypothetical protein
VGIAPMQDNPAPNALVGEQSRQVRDWVLAILHFALTLDPADRAAAMAKAADMDRLGSGKSPSQFTYFVRTSVEFCNCIVDRRIIDKAKVLRGHLRKIDDDRLRRLLRAALTRTKPVPHRDRFRDNLWKGLAAR